MIASNYARLESVFRCIGLLITGAKTIFAIFLEYQVLWVALEQSRHNSTDYIAFISLFYWHFNIEINGQHHSARLYQVFTDGTEITEVSQDIHTVRISC